MPDLERELTRFVAVAASAFQGDELYRHPSDWEIRKLRHLALHDHRSPLTLERLDPEEHRRSARARGAVEDDVDALAAGELEDAVERVLLLDVDRVVGAERPRKLEARRITIIRETANDDTQIIFGATIDERLTGQVWVTVIATGLGAPQRRRNSFVSTLTSERNGDELEPPSFLSGS